MIETASAGGVTNICATTCKHRARHRRSAGTAAGAEYAPKYRLSNNERWSATEKWGTNGGSGTCDADGTHTRIVEHCTQRAYYTQERRIQSGEAQYPPRLQLKLHPCGSLRPWHVCACQSCRRAGRTQQEHTQHTHHKSPTRQPQPPRRFPQRPAQDGKPSRTCAHMPQTTHTTQLTPTLILRSHTPHTFQPTWPTHLTSRGAASMLAEKTSSLMGPPIKSAC